MEHITKSRASMLLAGLAAMVYVVGLAFEIGGYAVLTPARAGLGRGLIRTADWLVFAAWALLLTAVCAAWWQLMRRKAPSGAREVGVAALGTLIIAVGALVWAVTFESSTSGHWVAALGVAVWALLVLGRAARRSRTEQEAADQGNRPPGQAMLWMIAGYGLILLSIGVTFTPPVTNSQGAVTAGVLAAAGTAIVLGVLAAARVLEQLRSPAAPVAMAGLAFLAASFTAAAIAKGLVFGIDVTLTGVRVAIVITSAIGLVAAAVLGIAAAARLRELTAV